MANPGNSEIEGLLSAEQSQRFLYDGLTSVETQAASEWLYDGQIGEILSGNGWNDWTTHLKKLIQVDESKWYPFFRKSHWFDLGNDPKIGIPNPIPPLADWKGNPYWSVDSEPVWEQLRVSIELADRILKQLINEGHEWFVRYSSIYTPPLPLSC